MYNCSLARLDEDVESGYTQLDSTVNVRVGAFHRRDLLSSRRVMHQTVFTARTAPKPVGNYEGRNSAGYMTFRFARAGYNESISGKFRYFAITRRSSPRRDASISSASALSYAHPSVAHRKYNSKCWATPAITDPRPSSTSTASPRVHNPHSLRVRGPARPVIPKAWLQTYGGKDPHRCLHGFRGLVSP